MLQINIDMDRKCAECGKKGAADSGICLKCVSAAVAGKQMKSPAGRAVKLRFQELKNRHR